MMKIGEHEAIRALMHWNRVKMKEVAELVGISPQSMSQSMKRDMRVNTFLKVVKALHGRVIVQFDGAGVGFDTDAYLTHEEVKRMVARVIQSENSSEMLAQANRIYKGMKNHPMEYEVISDERHTESDLV